MFVASYLQLSRHRVFYFRIVIPRALRGCFINNPREIKLSLRTCDRATALTRARALHVKIDELFSQSRANMSERIDLSKITSFSLGFDQSGRVIATDIGPGEAESAFRAMIEANKALAPTANLPTLGKKNVLFHANLSEIVEKYLALYKDGVAVPTFKKREAHLKVFIEYFEDAKISDITRAGLSDYWDDLKYFPPQKDLRPEFLNWKLDKVLESQKKLAAMENSPFKGISKQTQAHYREAVSGLYEWCADRDIVETNLATSKSTRGRKYKNEVANVPRDTYTASDLKRIFENDFFTQHRYVHPYQYWVPHIALYTGARINEISQLYLEDVSEYEGYLAIKFCAVDGDEDAGGTRVRRDDILKKNENSVRLTPVHPKLVELGFLDFVKSIKEEGHIRLFPELTFAAKGGYGTRVSRWYNEEFLRPKVGIKNANKVFHSFRHTVLNGLGAQLFDMPGGRMVADKDLICKAIVGHKMQGITFGHYLKQFHPKITSYVLEPLFWDVDLTAYTPLKRKRARVLKQKKQSEATENSPSNKSNRITYKTLQVYDGDDLPILPEL